MEPESLPRKSRYLFNYFYHFIIIIINFLLKDIIIIIFFPKMNLLNENLVFIPTELLQKNFCLSLEP